MSYYGKPPAPPSKTVSVNFSWPWASILTIVFVVLKLTGNIAWSWWWVLSPLWIIGLIVLLFMVIVFFIALFKS